MAECRITMERQSFVLTRIDETGLSAWTDYELTSTNRELIGESTPLLVLTQFGFGNTNIKEQNMLLKLLTVFALNVEKESRFIFCAVLVGR